MGSIQESPEAKAQRVAEEGKHAAEARANALARELELKQRRIDELQRELEAQKQKHMHFLENRIRELERQVTPK